MTEPVNDIQPAVPAATLAGIDLGSATIPDLQRAMDEGTFTSEQLVDLYLARIAALNPLLNAVIAVNDDAGREARESDERRSSGRSGVLEGIPVLLKDNVGAAGMPTSAGSMALADAESRDAFLVTRLRAAGAVILGKTNLSEWANFRSRHSSSGWSAVGGQTHNPHVLDRSPSGSSSGSAVAAAANLATVTIGSETDGSIVSPAGVNGIVGLKPTLGLVSRTGVVPITSEQDTAGPIARSVTDAVVVLGVLTGVDPTDPATQDSAAHAQGDYSSLLTRDALSGKRIGVWDADVTTTSPATASVLDSAIETMQAAGATVVRLEHELPHQSVVSDNELPAMLTEFRRDIDAYLAELPGEHPRDLAGVIAYNSQHADAEMPHFGQDLLESALAAPLPDDATYLEARRAATAAARTSIDETLAASNLDAIVAPTNGPAWPIDLEHGDDLSGTSSSTPAAVAGYPNITVPMGFVGELPVGVSFFAGRWSEPTLIGIAYSYEQHSRARRAPRFLPTEPNDVPGAGTSLEPTEPTEPTDPSGAVTKTG